MKETQPSITSADEYDGYQHTLADVTAECAGTRCLSSPGQSRQVRACS